MFSATSVFAHHLLGFARPAVKLAARAATSTAHRNTVAELADGAQPSKGCGHVFVLHCNGQELAADAILIPLHDDSAPGDPGASINRLYDTKTASSHPGVAAVYEGQITSRYYRSEDEAVAGALAAATEYLEQAGAELHGATSGFKRGKPLIALPLPGVGHMDTSDLIQDMGQIVEQLLPRLYKAANKHAVDIALCTTDKRAFNVAQVMRTKCCPFEAGPFWMLSPELSKQAEQLQQQAADGRLSVLFGAGISFSSGLPSWSGLLKELATRAGFDDAEKAELDGFAKSYGYLDLATLIQRRMGDEAKFKQTVADCTEHGRFTPCHALLGSMRLPAVTTNYDPFYEDAVGSAAKCDEDRVQTLPWDAAGLDTMPMDVRRLLKLHGCVKYPSSIVLTHKDYMRYEDTRRALRGRVHSDLIGRNVLVLGFSMTDDNVQLIIDQVREALGDAPQDGFMMGTVITMTENALFRELWEKEFHVVSCGKTWKDDLPPGWVHDCFVDALASGIVQHGTAGSFILDPDYASMLTDEQKAIKAALLPLQALLQDNSINDTACRDHVAGILRVFGSEPTKKITSSDPEK